MIPEIIFLYGKEKRHDEALNKLIELGEYQWAESYCCEYTDNLLTKLFRKYIDFFRYTQSKASSGQEEFQRLIKVTA